MQPAIQPSMPGLPLVVVRVFLGITFLGSDHGNGSPDELPGFLGFAMRNAYPGYRDFLASVVAPHATLFATLTTIGEIVVGGALILGIGTRLAGVAAIFVLANYLCAKGTRPWVPSIDASDIALAVLIVAGAAGRRLGADTLLHRRFPGVPLW